MDTSIPPFVAVDGVFNFRDIGGHESSHSPHCSVRPGCVFRCANPGRVTSKGVQQIRDLGIMKVFDLRSSTEIERTADFGPTMDIPGVERVLVPVYVHGEYPAHQSVKNLENYRHDAISAYVEILIAGKSAFRTIFIHLRDMRLEACLIHCSAGKDRTGVAVALILAVAGVDDLTIAREYQLTKEGLRPMRPVVIHYLTKKSGAEWTEQQVSKLLDVRCEAMAQMLDVLRDEYGGAEGYLRSQCDFSDHDIASIKENLLVRS